MKRILTSSITSSSNLPIIKQGLDFLQDSYKEILSTMVTALLGSYTANDVIILDGCVITGSGTYAVTAGAIYYNGETYLVDAASGLTPGGSTMVWKIVQTFDTFDPIYFSDKTQHSVHQISKIALQVGASGSGIANYNGATVKNFTSTTTIVGLIATETSRAETAEALKADKSQLLVSSISGVGPTSYPTPGTDTVMLTLTPSASKAAAIMKYTFMGYLSNDVADTAIVKIKKNGTEIASTKTTVPIGQINFCLTWIGAYAANDVITATVTATADGGDINNYILICESLAAA